MMRTTKGFTLIELIVVFGIIALMSSLVLAGLTLARAKAQDAAIKRSVSELRTLMAREMSDNGSYQNLKDGGGWKTSNSTCTTGTLGSVLKGTYASDAKKICDVIIRQASPACASNCLFFNTASPPSGVAPESVFSIMAYLPGASRMSGHAMYLCMGSSGRVSTHDSVTDPTFSSGGCQSNP